MKKFLAFAVLNFVLFLGAAILSSSAQAQSASVTIQCNDTNNPQINSQNTNSLSLQSGNVTCTATAYSGIASGYWQVSDNGGPFQYATGAQVSISGSGIPHGIYQVRVIGTDANANPITPSNVVTINYSAQSAHVTIQCNDTNNPQINSQSTDSLSLQSGNVTCTATAYSGIASGYWQVSDNGGPFQYATGAQVSISGSGIPHGIYQVRVIGTDANGNPITPSNVVTINYSASGSGSGSGTGSASGSGSGSSSGSGTGSASGSGSGSGSGTGSTSGSGSGSSSGSGNASGSDPGPSASLFNAPYYQCKANYYVSNSGSDSNNGSNGAPWATLQHADSMNVGAGACINVAPGSYDGVAISHGGDLASATGYVVYRCQTLDGCLIRGNAGVNGNASFETDTSAPNFIQVDGFEMAQPANQNFAVGFNINGGGGNASHHVWVLNSIIHGFSQSGISTGSADFAYFIHNTSYDNSRSTSANCGAQGSGISMYEVHSTPGYTPTADDVTNPNPLLGPTWQIGSDFFHFVIEYNVLYNNALTNCGTVSNPFDTDGNGIIFDTFLADGGNTENYPHPSLAAFNVVYNNGGSGIHVFDAAHVTVANNSCFNNQQDPANNGTLRACLDDSGFDNHFINNIAVAIPFVTTDCSVSPPYAKFSFALLGQLSGGSPADTFSNNLTDMIGVGCQPEVVMQNGDVYNTPPNIESTNPGWVNVGTSSVGTETTPPIGTNFALQPGSKAIGAGLTEPYLPASSVDIGACASALTTCP